MEREMMEDEREDVWEDAADSSEIPPYITEVECSEVTEEGENKGKMEYIVSFDTKDKQTASGTYMLGIKSDDASQEPIEVPVSKSRMQGTLYCDVSTSQDYYLYVYPQDNPGAVSKMIVALPKTGFQVQSIGLTSDTKLLFAYQCERLIPKTVVVGLKGTDSFGASVKRDVELTPFVRLLDLCDYGMEAFSSLEISSYAEYYDCGAEIIFYEAETYTVQLGRPEVTQICVEHKSDGSDEEDTIHLEVTMKQTLYTGAALYAEVFREGETVYQTEAVSAAQTGGAYRLAIPVEELETGGFADYEVRFRCKQNKLFTGAGRAYRLITQCPETEQVRWKRAQDGAKWDVFLRMAKNCDFPHKYYVKESGATVSACRGENQTEILSLKESTLTEVSLAYSSGLVRGPVQETVHLTGEQFYVTAKDGKTILCLSDTPGIDMTADIKVALDGISCGETVDGGSTFQLLSDSGKTYLKMAAAVWDFSGGGEPDSDPRKTVRTDYGSFLQKLEEKQYTVSEIRRIRRVIGDYLPMTFEEQAFFKLYFRADYAEAKSTVELIPGITVRINYSMYECVGDEADSQYLNDYVASAQEQFCVVERDGKLCLDPYVRRLGNGSYVDSMLQPTTAKEGQPADNGYYTTGGAAVIDLQSSVMEQPYLVLAYHSKFPAVGTLINPMMARNAALLASPSYGDLTAGVAYFFENNATDCTTASIRGGYLKGRVHMTPCMEIMVNGNPCTVPFFTTVADIADRFGMDTQHLNLKRGGRRVDGAYEQISSLPLYLGDCLYDGSEW